jgi:hypothetical protein
MNPSERIDHLIAGLTDWRGKTLARRALGARQRHPYLAAFTVSVREIN